MNEHVWRARNRLVKAIADYSPIAVFGLFSGGHDSFTASYIASLVPQFTGCVHINTGIGIEDTREYVRKTCHDRGWNLFEYKAENNVNAKGEDDPIMYDAIVKKYGFPGPAQHGAMYSLLKERQLRRLERDFGADGSTHPKKRVLYVSGARSQESRRRMGTTNEITLESRRVWCAPIHDFSASDCGRLMQFVEQPRNRVVDLIHKSGECLCGAMADPDGQSELEELRVWFPDVAARIDKLQVELINQFPWGWGEKQPSFVAEKKQGQCFMFDYEKTEIDPQTMHLCWSCKK